MNIATLLQEQSLLMSRVDKTLHGSLDIREQNGKKYIYVHFREDGVNRTKYAGEYSVELHNLILENNELVKQLQHDANKYQGNGQNRSSWKYRFCRNPQ